MLKLKCVGYCIRPAQKIAGFISPSPAELIRHVISVNGEEALGPPGSEVDLFYFLVEELGEEFVLTANLN